MSTSSNIFDSVEGAIQDIADGKLVIVTDDENRENEGDLVMAAEKATTETINMMILHARGLICVPTVQHQLKRLGINSMVAENRESHQTDFTVSVDAAEGITTGISAYDRAQTIRLLADPSSTPDHLVQPGHIFPLRARPGGVLQRAGHTEAAVDLASLAGLFPSGVICEILREDGEMARIPDLLEFKKKFGLKMISIAQLIEYRHARDKLVSKLSQSIIDTKWGSFDYHVFKSHIDDSEHFALTKGDISTGDVLVRVHRQNELRDLFGSSPQTPNSILDLSLQKIASENKGVLIYIHSKDQIQIPNHKNKKTRPSPSDKMDLRDYGVGAQILTALDLKRIRLMTSEPRKVIGLDGFDLEIVEQIPLQ